jgi:hypothetical protein
LGAAPQGEIHGTFVRTRFNLNAEFIASQKLKGFRACRLGLLTSTGTPDPYTAKDEYAIALYANIQPIGLSPWFYYANTGNAIDSDGPPGKNDFIAPAAERMGHTISYVGGISYGFATGGLHVGVDAAYGTSKSDAEKEDMLADGVNPLFNPYETSGYFAALGVDYTFDFANVGIFSWYGSGSKEKDALKQKYGILPVLAGDGNFHATMIGCPTGIYGLEDTFLAFSPVGTFALGASVNRLEFVANLTHAFTVAYVVGTNEKRSAPGSYTNPYHGAPGKQFLTKEDYFVELNFATFYQIEENFQLGLQAAYFINEFAKEADGGVGRTKNSYLVQAGAMFAF